MGFEYKAADVNGLMIEDEGQGIVTAIVSVTGIEDSVKDVIEPGAYERTLKARQPKGIWHHDWHQPVSKTLEAEELRPLDPRLPKTLADGKTPWPATAGALKIKQQFNLATDRGKTAYEDVKFFGAEQEWSIGYKVPKGGAVRDPRTGVRYIKSLDLFEYSPVLVGTMPMAHTLSVKDAQEAFRSGEYDDYDPETDFTEEKTGEGIGLHDDEVLDRLSELLPVLTELQGYLTQKTKRDTERQAEQERFEAAREMPIAAVKSDVEEIVDLDITGLTLKQLTEDVLDTTFGVKSDSMTAEDEELVAAAEDFDYALEQEDEGLIDEKADAFLDALEVAIDGSEGEAKNDLRYLARDLAQLIDSVEPAEEKSPSAAKREKAAEKGNALPDGSFPIDNLSDLRKAVSAYGRAKDKVEAKAHIIKRARALDAIDKLPESWGVKSEEIVGDGETMTLNLADFDMSAMRV